MLLAHLRGLLSPEAPATWSAMAGEKLVLDALECTITADQLNHMTLVSMMQAASAGRPEDRKELVSGSLEMSEQARYLNNLEVSVWKNRSKRDSVDTMIKIYEMLEKKGALDE
jgi:hypothetical protein